MKELYFFNKNSGIEMGFPELERITRLEIPRGKISDAISLREDGFCFKLICLKGVCALYREKDFFKERDFQTAIFQTETLDCQSLPDNSYFIANRSKGKALALILKIKNSSVS